jgi:hypothetical protein
MLVPEPGRDFYSYLLSTNVVGVIRRRGGLWHWHLEDRQGLPHNGKSGTCKGLSAAYAAMLRAHEAMP